jgi:hypothetical protein
MPEPGFYYHYKHDSEGPINEYAYEVTGIGKHSETDEFLVLYRPFYENIWQKPASHSVRPLAMFMETVTKDGRTFPRFSKITDPDIIAKLEAIKKEMYGN